MRAARAILFDAEGVIIDTEGTWDKSQRIFLERRGLVYDRARVKHLLAGRSLDEGTAILKSVYGLMGTITELAAERRELVGELIARERIRLIPGFASFYAKSVAAGFTTCIATSMEPALFQRIAGVLGLREYFSNRVYFTADVQGRAKPDPAVFLYAAQSLGCAPADCLVIEDSPAGIAAARSAGMQSVALTTTFAARHLAAADSVCAGFEQIPELQLA